MLQHSLSIISAVLFQEQQFSFFPSLFFSCQEVFITPTELLFCVVHYNHQLHVLFCCSVLPVFFWSKNWAAAAAILQFSLFTLDSLFSADYILLLYFTRKQCAGSFNLLKLSHHQQQQLLGALKLVSACSWKKRFLKKRISVCVCVSVSNFGWFVLCWKLVTGRKKREDGQAKKHAPRMNK